MRVFVEKAVLFLHAFPLNSEMYCHQFDFLEKEGIPYIAVDYPGFGNERNFPSEYTVETLTDIIIGKVKDFGVKKLIPVGDSMGGYVMFDIWRRYPEVVDGFVFVSTRAEADTEEAKKARYATIEKVQKEGKDFLIDFMLDAQTSPTTKKDNKKMEKLRCIMEQATEEGIIKALKALADRPDNTGLLPSINIPTVVIAGKDDEKVTPPDIVRKIAEGITGSKFIEIENSAHLPPFENPEMFNKILLEFIKGIWR
ncbi:Pimeloyl-ACP methyl ester carboxylesterase [Persephonella hydrogeniphila]|uniref:Pimeloyl-ACP methyl ester carboxylesterase n=1 Tax=Persephonella hydrogeniphila TaxID=198703 RepID=A0A285MZK3_9AQUI|nr:alpha/beta hydrolase [Persephonella hydrogeniphila]SNZ02625.1 Pimeloyl-ACP methyl ester carboxylesterase [Persephonella hydrogeniphila]